MKSLTLQPGDTVDIVAPGFRCDMRDVRAAAERLKSWGLKPRIPKNLFGKDVVCGQSDKIRWEHLKKALTSKDSKMIWCVRGGYGAIRLLDQMQKMNRPAEKKWVLGYSDITSLHAFLNRCWKWPSLHGPLLERFGQKRLRAKDEAFLKDILFGKIKHHTFKNLQPLNAAAKKKRQITGEMIGGNLTVVSSVIGLPWQYDSRGKILFFEDIGERGYRVDRLLKYFMQVGFLEGVKAIIFGEFIGGTEKNGRDLCIPVIRRFAAETKIPVFMGLPVGHGDKQMTIPIGTKAKLKTGSRSELYVNY